MKPKRPTLADVQGKVAANPTLAALNPHLFPAPTANAAGSPARPDEPQAAPSRPGKRRKDMNKTAALYAKILEVKQSKGEIESFHYEGITLRWGSLDNIQYTPDFAVFIDGKLKKLIETKGAHIWPAIQGSPVDTALLTKNTMKEYQSLADIIGTIIGAWLAIEFYFWRSRRRMIGGWTKPKKDNHNQKTP